MKNKIYFILLSLILTSCYNDNEQDIYGEVTCDTTDVTFSNSIQPIIDSSCATTGCHVSGGTGSGDFTSFNGIQSKINNGSFENRVLVQKDMPPGTPLSDCDLELIQAWLDAGALNN